MPNNDVSCPACGRAHAPNARFCTECGTALPDRCLRCREPLQGYESFCMRCGAPVDMAGRPSTPCTSCEHYREAVTPSALLTVNAAVPDVAEALVKIKEEEVRLRDEEAKVLVEHLKVGAEKWGFRPLMHSYCGEHEDQGSYEVEGVKNLGGHCASFTSRKTVAQTECVKCLHRSVPPDQVRDRCRGILDPKLYADCVNAVYKGYGLEVTEGWIGKGLLPCQPEFQETCLAYTAGGAFALCDYLNMRRRCPRYDPARPEFAIAAS